MKIRKATIKDTEEISKLMREYDFYENKLDQNVSISSIKEIKKDIKEFFKNKSVLFLIAEEYQEIIGIISVSIDKRGKMKIGRIQDIIVKKEHRGKNVGKTLVEGAEKYFKRNSCIKIQSFVREKNINAQKFWKNQGFNFEKAKGFIISKRLK